MPGFCSKKTYLCNVLPWLVVAGRYYWTWARRNCKIWGTVCQRSETFHLPTKWNMCGDWSRSLSKVGDCSGNPAPPLGSDCWRLAKPWPANGSLNNALEGRKLEPCSWDGRHGFIAHCKRHYSGLHWGEHDHCLAAFSLSLCIISTPSCLVKILWIHPLLSYDSGL